MARLAIASKILLSQQVCAEQKIWFSHHHNTAQTTMLRARRTRSRNIEPLLIITLLWRHLQWLPASPPHADLPIARPVAVSCGSLVVSSWDSAIATVATTHHNTAARQSQQTTMCAGHTRSNHRRATAAQRHQRHNVFGSSHGRVLSPLCQEGRVRSVRPIGRRFALHAKLRNVARHVYE